MAEYKAFADGFTAGFVPAAKRRAARISVSSEAVEERVNNYYEAKKEAEELDKDLDFIIDEMGLDIDGSHAVKREIYPRLQAYKDSPNRVKLIMDELKEEGYKGQMLVGLETTSVEEQTNQALPVDTKTKVKEAKPETNVSTDMLGLDSEKVVKVSPQKSMLDRFVSHFNVDGRVAEDVLNRTRTKFGDELVLDYLAKADTDKDPMDFAPEFELVDPDTGLPIAGDLPAGVSIQTVFQTEFGKGFTPKSLSKLTVPEMYSLVKSWEESSDPEAKAKATAMQDRITDAIKKQAVVERRTSLDPKVLSNAAELDFLITENVYKSDNTPNILKGESRQQWEERKNKVLNRVSDDPFWGTLTSIDSMADIPPAKQKFDQLLAEGLIDQAKHDDGLKRLSELEVAFQAVKDAEKDSETASSGYCIGVDSGKVYGQCKVTASGLATFGNKPLNPVMIGDEQKPEEIAVIPQEEIKTYRSFVKDNDNNLSGKALGFSATTGYFQQMDALLSDEDTGQLILRRGGVIDIFNDYKETLRAYLKLSKGKNITYEGFIEYAKENVQAIEGKDFPTKLGEISVKKAKFETLKIQAAYALAQALGQEGKGLSDTDLELQLMAIGEDSPTAAAARARLRTVMKNLHQRTENERIAYVQKFEQMAFSDVLTKRIAATNPNYVVDRLGPASTMDVPNPVRDYFNRAMAQENTNRNVAPLDNSTLDPALGDFSRPYLK